MADSCEISLRFILFLQRLKEKTNVIKLLDKYLLKIKHSLDSYFFNILADSSLGSMTSTAHPIDSSAFKLSNNSSLFSSFKVFESALKRTENSVRETFCHFRNKGGSENIAPVYKGKS